jgi:hypothetical protein
MPQISFPELLAAAYPRFNWEVDRLLLFEENSMENSLNQIAKKLNINELEDWYKVTQKVTGMPNWLVILRILILLVGCHVKDLFLSCFLRSTPTTSGYHGNLANIPQVFGKMRKIRENIWNGLQMN